MKILIVSHYYLPFTGVGAKKVSSLANYLSERGDNIFILKTSNRHYNTQISETESNSKLKIFEVDKTKTYKRQFLENFSWKREYKKEIKRIILTERIELIIFSGGPFFYFPLGNYFFKKLNIKYILDFRDPWIASSSLHYKKSADLIKRIKIFCIAFFNSIEEKRSVKHAEWILVPSKEICTIMQDHYKLQKKNKIQVIMNGYDESKMQNIDLCTLRHNNKSNKTVLGIFGSFSYYSTPYLNDFFIVIKELIKEGHNIEILHIGKQEDYMIDLAKKYNLSEYYIPLGNMKYEDGIKQLKTCNILLINDNSIVGHGTKIFDYIYVNKPIVAFVPNPSAIATLLENFKHGFSCNNKYQAFHIFKHLISNKINCLDASIDIEKYSRSYQYKTIFELIHQ